MNQGKYIETSKGKFQVRTSVGSTYFTYEDDENSHFNFEGDFVQDASNLKVEARIVEQ